MAIEDFYVSCVRKRASANVVNERYENQITYTDTLINGYIGQRSEIEIEIAGKKAVKSQFNFFTDDLAIEYNDYIVYKSKTYRVISQPMNPAHLNHHVEVIVELYGNVP